MSWSDKENNVVMCLKYSPSQSLTAAPPPPSPFENQREMWGVFYVPYRIKPEELPILSCEKGPRPKAEAFFTAKNGEHRGFSLTWSTSDHNEDPS